MRLLGFGCLAVLCAFAAPGTIHAHEYWLSLDRWIAPPGQEVALSALAGTGFHGERKAYAPGRVVRLVARTGVLLDLRPGAASGDSIWSRYTPVDEGGTMFGYESNFASIELAADEFDAYLKEEGLDGPLAARRKAKSTNPGRERYRRCAKAWLPGDDATRATLPLNLPLEIVPLAAPGADPKLEVMVLADGKPLANALVKAWRAPLDTNGTAPDPETRDSTGVVSDARTNRDGRATLSVKAAGEWLVSVVHMAPCREPEVADWESSWASLTFARFR